MFIINLTYKVELAIIDQHLEAHRAFLAQQYEQGNFLASGPKNPRVGGIILSQVADRKKVEEIIDQDPFKQHEVADYELIEFIPLKTSEELAFLRKG